jgi:hypothetical protein
MRDGEPVNVGTPRVSLDIALENNRDSDEDGVGGKFAHATPPTTARNMFENEEESALVLQNMRGTSSPADPDKRVENSSRARQSPMDAEREAGSQDGMPADEDLLPQDELMLASDPLTPHSDDDDADSKLDEAQTRSGSKQGIKSIASHRSARKRKASALVQIDRETELSANFFRRCLHDTSDIVRVHKRVRLRADAIFDVSEMENDGATAGDVFIRHIFPGLAPELNEVFARCFKAQNVLESTTRGHDRQIAGRDDSESESESSSIKRSKVTSAHKGSEEQRYDGSQIPIVAGDHDHDTGRFSLPSAGLESANRASELEIDGIDLPNNLDASIGARSPDDLAAQRNGEGSIRLSPGDNACEINLSPHRLTLDDLNTARSDAQSRAVEDSAPVVEQEPDAEQEFVVGREGETGSPTKISLLDVANTSLQISPDDADRPVVAGDARMTARALKMRDYLTQRVDEAGSVCFTDKLQEEAAISRRTAARSFYELLNLCSRGVVTLDQDKAYGSIHVTPVAPAFETSQL